MGRIPGMGISAGAAFHRPRQKRLLLLPPGQAWCNPECLLPAPGPRLPAGRAPGRGVPGWSADLLRGGNGTVQLDSFGGHIPNQQVGRAQEGGTNSVCGAGKALRRTHFLQAPIAHHPYSVRQVEGFFLVVGDEDRRNASLRWMVLRFRRSSMRILASRAPAAHRAAAHRACRPGRAPAPPAAVVRRELPGHAIAQACQPTSSSSCPGALSPGGRLFTDTQAKFDVIRRSYIGTGHNFEHKPYRRFWVGR